MLWQECTIGTSFFLLFFLNYGSKIFEDDVEPGINETCDKKKNCDGFIFVAFKYIFELGY